MTIRSMIPSTKRQAPTQPKFGRQKEAGEIHRHCWREVAGGLRDRQENLPARSHEQQDVLSPQDLRYGRMKWT